MKGSTWLVILGGGVFIAILGLIWANMADGRALTCAQAYRNAVANSGAETEAFRCVADALAARSFGRLVAAAGTMLALAGLVAAWLRGKAQREAVEPTKG